MNPKVSKELRKATEELQAKMLVMQDAEAKMLTLKNAFVKEADPVKREKLKKAILIMHKELKAAEAAADAADKVFHRILATEPEEDVQDLLDHKLQETLVRLAVRKMIKRTLTEAKEEDAKETTDLHSTEEAVFDFFNKNKKKFEKLADEDEWDDLYDMAFEKFPDADQDDVAQSINKAMMMSGWIENEDIAEMPTEKELETMAFGEKSQQKGIKMGDYDKKMKTPKQSPSELYIEEGIKKKEKIEEAEYRGRTVKLGKPFYTPGGPRKRAVYVRNDKGNVVKVGFGEPGMKIKKGNPARRKSFRARHNCDNPGPRWKARYWSCRAW